MVGFFVISGGICVWLAIIGVVLIGIATEVDEEDPALATTRVAALAVSGTLCAGLAVVYALMNWGVVALTTYVVLALGLGVTAAGAVPRYTTGQSWHEIPIPLIGGAVSFLAALVAFCVALPSLSALEYVEYSYGTEVRTLEYDQDPSGAHLVKQSGENYIFRYSHKSGDAFGVRRRILERGQVVFLDEGSADASYVEGEVVAMAKIDPISGRPLETQSGKTFRPTTLYVLPSDVWNASTD